MTAVKDPSGVYFEAVAMDTFAGGWIQSWSASGTQYAQIPELRIDGGQRIRVRFEAAALLPNTTAVLCVVLCDDGKHYPMALGRVKR